MKTRPLGKASIRNADLTNLDRVAQSGTFDDSGPALDENKGSGLMQFLRVAGYARVIASVDPCGRTG